MVRKLIAAAGALAVMSVAHAGPKERCVASGEVFRNAMTAEALRLSYAEVHDWRRTDYYSLPQEFRTMVEQTLEQMRPQVQSTVDTVMGKIPKWNRDGLDGRSIARQIMLGGFSRSNDDFAVMCLKTLEAQGQKF